MNLWGVFIFPCKQEFPWGSTSAKCCTGVGGLANCLLPDVEGIWSNTLGMRLLRWVTGWWIELPGGLLLNCWRVEWAFWPSLVQWSFYYGRGRGTFGVPVLRRLPNLKRLWGCSLPACVPWPGWCWVEMPPAFLLCRAYAVNARISTFIHLAW